MDSKRRWYAVLRALLRVTLGLVKPVRVIGRENIPEGAAVICANHTSWIDPFFMAFAVPSRYHLCLMAKKELFKNKLVAFVLHAIGTFPVDRGAADMNAMKSALHVLKSGKKLGIFPEGTRTAEDGSVTPKAGAVRLAEKTGAPLVPMYIPRKKGTFRRSVVVIGEPIVLEAQGKRKHAELESIAQELMDKIARLGDLNTRVGRD